MKTRVESRKRKRVSARDVVTNAPGWESTSIKPPKGVEFFKLVPGQMKVDFMSYIVKLPSRNIEAGDEYYRKEYEGHKIPNASGGNNIYVCRKVFGKACACCDWLIKNGATADQDLVKQLRAKTRSLWLVNDQLGAEKPTYKVLDQAWFGPQGAGFGEKMQDRVASLDENVEPFHPSCGMTAVLTVKEMSWPGGKFNGVTLIDFIPRKKQYDDSVVENAPCLDDCLIDPGYEPVMRLLETGQSNGEEEEENEKHNKSTTTSAKQTQSSSNELDDDEEDSELDSELDEEDSEVEEPSDLDDDDEDLDFGDDDDKEEEDEEE